MQRARWQDTRRSFHDVAKMCIQGGQNPPMTAAPHVALQFSNSKFPTKQGCQDSLWTAHELPEEGLSTRRLVRHLHTANWQACVWTGVCQ